MMEVECVRPGCGLVEGDIFGGSIVVVVVEMVVGDLKLEVGGVVRIF